jgi:hypothetical protein
MVPEPLQWCPVDPEMNGLFARGIAMVPSGAI